MDRWDELKNVYGDAPPSFEARIRLTLDNLPEEQPVVYRRRRKPLATMLAAAVMVVILAGTAFATGIFGLGSIMLGMVGFLILAMLPVGIITSRVLWKKGIIKVIDKEQA